MSASDPSSAPPTPAPITGKTAIASGLGAAAGLALAMAVAAIKPDEGKVNRVYADVASIPTSCFGHREAPGTKLGTPRTDEQCTTLLAGDVERTEAACSPVPLPCAIVPSSSPRRPGWPSTSAWGLLRQRHRERLQPRRLAQGLRPHARLGQGACRG